MLLSCASQIARDNPKHFYKQVTKPYHSTKIVSLKHKGVVHTSDEGIEHACTDFIKNICNLDEQIEPDPDDSSYTHNPKLNSLMDVITPHELNSALADLDGSSSAGFDNISPKLLKYALTQTWTVTEPKPPADIDDERRELLFAQDMADERNKLTFQRNILPVVTFTFKPSVSSYFSVTLFG